MIAKRKFNSTLCIFVPFLLDGDALRRNFNSGIGLDQPSRELKLRLKASLPAGEVQKCTKSSLTQCSLDGFLSPRLSTSSGGSEEKLKRNLVFSKKTWRKS